MVRRSPACGSSGSVNNTCFIWRRRTALVLRWKGGGVGRRVGVGRQGDLRWSRTWKCSQAAKPPLAVPMHARLSNALTRILPHELTWKGRATALDGDSTRVAGIAISATLVALDSGWVMLAGWPQEAAGLRHARKLLFATLQGNAALG